MATDFTGFFRLCKEKRMLIQTFDAYNFKKGETWRIGRMVNNKATGVLARAARGMELSQAGSEMIRLMLFCS